MWAVLGGAGMGFVEQQHQRFRGGGGRDVGRTGRDGTTGVRVLGWAELGRNCVLGAGLNSDGTARAGLSSNGTVTACAGLDGDGTGWDGMGNAGMAGRDGMRVLGWAVRGWDGAGRTGTGHKMPRRGELED